VARVVVVIDEEPRLELVLVPDGVDAVQLVRGVGGDQVGGDDALGVGVGFGDGLDVELGEPVVDRVGERWRASSMLRAIRSRSSFWWAASALASQVGTVVPVVSLMGCSPWSDGC
jgi:hypothetical protein